MNHINIIAVTSDIPICFQFQFQLEILLISSQCEHLFFVKPLVGFGDVSRVFQYIPAIFWGKTVIPVIKTTVCHLASVIFADAATYDDENNLG